MVSRTPYDPQQALQHFRAVDPVLAELTIEVGDFQPNFRLHLTLFEALLQSIVYQQLSGHAAGAILKRILQLYSDSFPTPAAVIQTPGEDLRACGLSLAKIKAVKDLAEKTDQGLLPTRSSICAMSDTEIIDAFCKVRGIGPWTVEMLLIFNLGRPDVLPATDLGVRRGYSVAYQSAELPSPAELLAHGERWKPFRSVASWYLWQAADPNFRVAAS